MQMKKVYKIFAIKFTELIAFIYNELTLITAKVVNKKKYR